jgi:hypothetical protein
MTVSEDDHIAVFDFNGKPLDYTTNDYQDNRDGTITDHATGLMWQKGGSEEGITYYNAKDYIIKLNRDRFAGFSDWRLPTTPELLSLVEPERENENLFIDSVFNYKQIWCWSSDILSSGGAWVVGFHFGDVQQRWLASRRPYVRAVRQRK